MKVKCFQVNTKLNTEYKIDQRINAIVFIAAKRARKRGPNIRKI